VDPRHLLTTFGTAGLFGIVFAETGLLVGFFLPGDSLLVLAGLFAAVGADAPIRLHLGLILPGLVVAAVAGAQVGYLIGRRAGPALFRRPDSRLFKRKHVEKAQGYFDRHGGTTVLIARFIPIVRTFANPMAGVAGMSPRAFTVFNVAGGLVWTISVTMLGFMLGKTVPSAQHHLALIEGIIIVLSTIPIAVELVRDRARSRARASA
jgi:membrane-associated protein